MGFGSDFLDGFEMPFKYVYNKFDKADKVADKVLDAGASAAGGLADLLSGNSSILLYLGIGIVVVTVLPTVLNKVL